MTAAGLSVMETDTLKLLGTTLRGAMPLEENKNSKELRRLIVQLERQQRETQPRPGRGFHESSH